MLHYLYVLHFHLVHGLIAARSQGPLFLSVSFVPFTAVTAPCQKTRPGRGKPPHRHLPGPGTQGAHDPLRPKKSRNQWSQKPPEPWPPITNGTQGAHESGRGTARGIFEPTPEIRSHRESNSGPRSCHTELLLLCYEPVGITTPCGVQYYDQNLITLKTLHVSP
jgi:hypothetical protein